MSSKLLGNLKKGLLFILSAPAGTGKTTLAYRLCEEFEAVSLSISCTTRAPRPGEAPDVDYHFIDLKTFEEKLQNGEFLEHAKIFDNYYGTLSETVKNLQESGKHVLLVIDTQGMQQLKKLKLSAISIFILPPSWYELEKRLAKRGTEDAEEIEKRLTFAHEEVEHADLYDYEIINDNLETAYQTLRAIVIAEEHKKLKRSNHDRLAHN